MEQSKDTIDMVTTVTFVELEHGTGKIQAGPEQHDCLEEFTQRLGSGEFHTRTDIALPCGCIDGRCGCSLKPNSAGGTETLLVADDLTTQRFADVANDSTLAAYRNVLQFMRQAELPIGGHSGPHASDEKSDCGANDRLAEIYDALALKADVVRTVAASWGIEIDDADHESIIAAATARHEFSGGKAMLRELETQAGEDSVDRLQGDHKEVLAIINLRASTTLDRDAVKAEFGADYQAFNVDAWTFPEAAKIISVSDDTDEAHRKYLAMVYYNIATALVLCGPKMRIVVLH